MSADNHANYGKIGFAVLAGAIAIAITLVYIAGIGDSRDEMLVETYYDSPVSGLSVGSVVNFRGVKIGEVRKIGFVGNEYPDAEQKDWKKIYILMSISMRLMGIRDPTEQDDVRRGVDPAIHATVTASGITGISRIELNYPRMEIPHEQISWHPENAFVHPAPSLIDNFSVAATKVMGQINRMDFNGVWSNVQSVAQSLSVLSATASQTLDDQRAGIASIIRNADEISSTLKELAAELRENPSLLLRPRDPKPLPETQF